MHTGHFYRAMFTSCLLFGCSVDHHGDSDMLYWPGMEDSRHGFVPGLRLLPEFK